MTEPPYLTVEWLTYGHITMNWTHSGDDTFGYYIEACAGDDPDLLTSYYSTYNTALRTFIFPFLISGPMDDDTFYCVRVTALSELGHVSSRVARVKLGHLVSYTFFEGLITWPTHESDIYDAGPPIGNTFAASFSFENISNYQLPSTPETAFLPLHTIPLYVTGGITFGSFATIAPVPGDLIRLTNQPHPWVRPYGFAPPYVEQPPYPATGVQTGHQSDAEWLLPTEDWVDSLKTIDHITSSFNQQAGRELDPTTGEIWTREDLIHNYYWGWSWFAWSDFSGADKPGIGGGQYTQNVDQGQVTMLKAHVKFGYEPEYLDDDGFWINGDGDPGWTHTGTSGPGGGDDDDDDDDTPTTTRPRPPGSSTPACCHTAPPGGTTPGTVPKPPITIPLGEWVRMCAGGGLAPDTDPVVNSENWAL